MSKWGELNELYRYSELTSQDVYNGRGKEKKDVAILRQGAIHARKMVCHSAFRLRCLNFCDLMHEHLIFFLTRRNILCAYPRRPVGTAGYCQGKKHDLRVIEKKVSCRTNCLWSGLFAFRSYCIWNPFLPAK